MIDAYFQIQPQMQVLITDYFIPDYASYFDHASCLIEHCEPDGDLLLDLTEFDNF